jgi:hypothetical protein
MKLTSKGQNLGVKLMSNKTIKVSLEKVDNLKILSEMFSD